MNNRTSSMFTAFIEATIFGRHGSFGGLEIFSISSGVLANSNATTLASLAFQQSPAAVTSDGFFNMNAAARSATPANAVRMAHSRMTFIFGLHLCKAQGHVAQQPNAERW